MQRVMFGLDRFLRRRRFAVLGAWLLVLVVALPFSVKQADHLTGGGFEVPGSESLRVQHQLERDFKAQSGARLAAVLVPRAGTGADQLRAAVERLDKGAAAVAHVELAPRSRAKALAAAAGAHTTIVPLAVSVNDVKAADVAKDLRDRLGVGDGPRDGVETHLIGQGALWAGLQDLSKKDLSQAEKTGFPIVLIILLAVFGSLAAALLPLALGLVSVLITGGLIYALSLVTEMSVFVTNMASMIGIGVAVDYSLFVLARYREEVKAGRDPEEARRNALATSGVAVTFSGLTVMVSLAGLWQVHNTALRSMALGAILVVAVSVLAAATLLPVLISLLGHRAYARGRLATVMPLILRSRARRRPGSTGAAAPPRRGFWERWTAFVTRRPAIAAGLAAATLLVLAIPTLSMKTSQGALRQFPAGNETRTGVEAAAAITGPGAASPVRVVATMHRGTVTEPENSAALVQVRNALAADPAIASVTGARPSGDGRAALLLAIPRVDGESLVAKEMVKRLRHDLPASPAGRRADIAVGGPSAGQLDFGNQVAGSMWKIVLFVLALSFVVLMVVLRSIVLPLKAVLMNLLSVGAAYGVMVAVFQWGWLDGLLGYHSPGSIETITPPLVLAVVFGLSMDYEVFLLSRIKERYEATHDTKLAVAQGLGSSARTITSAALIMSAVFAVFVVAGVPSIKQLGLGNAVAVALDATLVRLVLVPAAMELFGEWNWWLPRRLDRLLPRATFEKLPEPAGAPAS